jgi:hypothetical protein
VSLQPVPSQSTRGRVNAHGFSLDVAVGCGAHQRKGLERLCRYITRPAIANERLKRNCTGQVLLPLNSLYQVRTKSLPSSRYRLLPRHLAAPSRFAFACAKRVLIPTDQR